MIKKLILLSLAAVMTAAPSYALDNISTNKDLRLKDLAGQEVDLAAFATESGKPLLLFFWTSWCPYCMTELKSVNAKSGETSGLTFMAVNAGETKTIAERIARNNKLEMRVLLDQDQKAVTAFGIIGVPTFILLDVQGNVVFKDNYFPDDKVKEISGK